MRRREQHSCQWKRDSLSDTDDYNALELALAAVYSNPENSHMADRRCIPFFRGETGIPPEQWMIHSSTVALKRCANINLAAHDLSMAEENDICAYKGTRRRVYRGALSQKNMSREDQQT